MAQGEAVRITGLKETVKRLKTFDAELVKEIKVIEREAMAPVAVLARAKAPVGVSNYDKHPGLLASTVRVSALQSSVKVSVGSAKTPYAGPIHFGWGRRHIHSNKFLYYAFDAEAPEVVRNVEHGVAELVARVFGGE